MFGRFNGKYIKSIKAIVDGSAVDVQEVILNGDIVFFPMPYPWRGGVWVGEYDDRIEWSASDGVFKGNDSSWGDITIEWDTNVWKLVRTSTGVSYTCSAAKMATAITFTYRQGYSSRFRWRPE